MRTLLALTLGLLMMPGTATAESQTTPMINDGQGQVLVARKRRKRKRRRRKKRARKKVAPKKKTPPVAKPAPAPEPPKAAPTPAPAASPDDDRDSLALMDFTFTEGEVNASTAEKCTDAATNAVTRLKLFNVITGNDIRSMIEQQQLKEMMNCDAESCMAQIAGALEARYMLTGKVSKAGSSWTVNLTLLDVETAQAVDRQTASFTDQAKIIEEVGGGSKRLFNSILAKEGGVAYLKVSEAGADILLDGETVGTSTGRLFKLPMGGGTHLIEIKKEGFTKWGRNIDVVKDMEERINIDLIPSQAYLNAKIAAAKGRRQLSMILGASAGALVLASGGANFQASSLHDRGVDLLNGSGTDNLACEGTCLDGDQRFDSTMTTVQLDASEDNYKAVEAEYGSVQSDQVFMRLMSQVSMGVAVVAGGTSAYLWMTAEDPAQYEQFLIDEAAPSEEEGAPKAAETPKTAKK
ncbi:MAG: hypothetical protein CMH50_11585 [Myxococcales bacterium]|nr:hypothetical protein [Myxococcales bacterium]